MNSVIMTYRNATLLSKLIINEVMGSIKAEDEEYLSLFYKSGGKIRAD
ncbi:MULTISPECIES: hypothetical protein [Pseudobutyrivibrio]|nr:MULTISPECIES: hypothetical protein [Pseudobutyrivibrio]MBR5952613.1 hypothetical protein [Pseudobutyrivibrio sp.]